VGGYETRIFRPTVSSAIKAVSEFYKVYEDNLFQGKRGQRNEARQVAMYLIRELCDQSLKEIQEFFPTYCGWRKFGKANPHAV